MSSVQGFLLGICHTGWSSKAVWNEILALGFGRTPGGSHTGWKVSNRGSVLGSRLWQSWRRLQIWTGISLLWSAVDHSQRGCNRSSDFGFSSVSQLRTLLFSWAGILFSSNLPGADSASLSRVLTALQSAWVFLQLAGSKQGLYECWWSPRPCKCSGKQHGPAA